MINNSVHIVSGIYKNTKIKFPNIVGLRPTNNRVKETLFNWISNQWNNDFSNRIILDLFAGSGSLGLEAASRGSEFITMVENNKKAINSIRSICQKLFLTKINLYHGNAIDFLKKEYEQQFDLILLDPPFKFKDFELIWRYLPKILKKDGLVYVETSSIIKIPEYLSIIKQSKAGIVKFCLCKY